LALYVLPCSFCPSPSPTCYQAYRTQSRAPTAVAVNAMTTVTSAVSKLTSRWTARAVPRLTNPRNRDVTAADFPTSPAPAAYPRPAQLLFLAGNICNILPYYSPTIRSVFSNRLVDIDSTSSRDS